MTSKQLLQYPVRHILLPVSVSADVHLYVLLPISIEKLTLAANKRTYVAFSK